MPASFSYLEVLMKNLVSMFVVSLIVAACGKPAAAPAVRQCSPDVVTKYRDLQAEVSRAEKSSQTLKSLQETKAKIETFKSANARINCQLQLNEGDKRFPSKRIVDLSNELNAKLEIVISREKANILKGI
jgi:cell shape-determining protein MreC